ncbi:hypothetical protein VNI00_018487, partial [Paramarasmius palmivorus]
MKTLSTSGEVMATAMSKPSQRHPASKTTFSLDDGFGLIPPFIPSPKAKGVQRLGGQDCPLQTLELPIVAVLEDFQLSYQRLKLFEKPQKAPRQPLAVSPKKEAKSKAKGTKETSFPLKHIREASVESPPPRRAEACFLPRLMNPNHILDLRSSRSPQSYPSIRIPKEVKSFATVQTVLSASVGPISQDLSECEGSHTGRAQPESGQRPQPRKTVSNVNATNKKPGSSSTNNQKTRVKARLKLSLGRG